MKICLSAPAGRLTSAVAAIFKEIMQSVAATVTGSDVACLTANFWNVVHWAPSARSIRNEFRAAQFSSPAAGIVCEEAVTFVAPPGQVLLVPKAKSPTKIFQKKSRGPKASGSRSSTNPQTPQVTFY